MKKSSEDIEWNYLSISKDGNTIAVFALEKGSDNERVIVNKLLETNLVFKKSTKEEYDSFDGEEEEIS